jgi:uncharacterized protein YjdB
VQWYDGTSLDVSLNVDDFSYEGYIPFACNNDWSVFDTTSATGYIIEIPNAIYINQITLSDLGTEIDLESNYQMNAAVNPETANQEDLIYYSDDENVVTVSNTGLVEPISYGSAIIYIYSSDYNVQAQFNVSVVEKVPLTSFEAYLDNYQMDVNTTEQVKINYNPIETTQKNLIYSSSDEFVATVDIYGKVNAIGVGAAKITVISSQNETIFDSFDLTVVNSAISVEFIESTYVTNLSTTDDDIMPLILPLDATNQNLIWESSNPEVAYVDNQNQLVKLQNEKNGSKLNETARSYKTISNEINTINQVEFVWFTDGIGWTSARNNLEETFDVMKHIYNISDMESGIMDEVFK